MSRTDRGDDVVPVHRVGVGVSQVLPVLVALEVARPGQLVYIEQPELHLHPAAQHALAGVLLRAARRGVLAVIETHSSLLLRAVQTAVARDPDALRERVQLHWFDRDPDGATVVSSAMLDEDGTFGAWPVDFGDVERKAEMLFLEASLAGDPDADVAK